MSKLALVTGASCGIGRATPAGPQNGARIRLAGGPDGGNPDHED
jgi:NADP-dependent 3-hydroxy acid dehydrogenase YdfG